MPTETALKPWAELADLEKREEIARRLGWASKANVPMGINDGTIAADGVVVWTTPDEKPFHACEAENLPDWPTNDGLAFTEVWPKLCSFVDGRPFAGSCELHWETMSNEPDRRRVACCWNENGAPHTRKIENFSGDTWSEVICRAAYELLKTA